MIQMLARRSVEGSSYSEMETRAIFIGRALIHDEAGRSPTLLSGCRLEGTPCKQAFPRENGETASYQRERATEVCRGH